MIQKSYNMNLFGKQLATPSGILFRNLVIILFSVMVSSCVTTDRLELLGEEEQITFLDGTLTYSARIDTGATTSSISATDIVLIDKEGEEWVSFCLAAPEKGGKPTTIERKLSRVVNIKRHGAKSQERFVVKLHAQMGNINDEFEFTLTDRSAYTYPALIGRNILNNRAVVDVSRKHSAGKTVRIDPK